MKLLQYRFLSNSLTPYTRGAVNRWLACSSSAFGEEDKGVFFILVHLPKNSQKISILEHLLTVNGVLFTFREFELCV